MPNLIDPDLRDPSPPVPGDAERAAVAARAHRLARKRRMLQGVGALGMVAAVAVGVAALTAGGTSGSGTSRIAPAGPEPATVETPAPVDIMPGPAVPTFSVSGTISDIPAGVTVTLTLSGDGGTFSAVARGAGNYSFGPVPAGEYQAMLETEDTSGTAARVARSVVTVSDDEIVNFALE